MDILIGIILTLLALALLLVSFSYARDHFSAARDAAPHWRALFALFWIFVVIFASIGFALDGFERFGWRDEDDARDCTMTVTFDEDDKATGSKTVCDVPD